MTDDERLAALVRGALPAVSMAAPSRDLWPAIQASRPLIHWSWTDLGIAGALGAAFIWQPGWFVWLAYHL